MSASAHHSFAMFDSDKRIRLTGQVTEIRWQNPHVYIHMEAPDAKGKMRHWTIECNNQGILNRNGRKVKMIKTKDQLTVVGALLHTREPGALLKQVKLD